MKHQFRLWHLEPAGINDLLGGAGCCHAQDEDGEELHTKIKHKKVSERSLNPPIAQQELLRLIIAGDGAIVGDMTSHEMFAMMPQALGNRILEEMAGEDKAFYRGVLDGVAQ